MQSLVVVVTDLLLASGADTWQEKQFFFPFLKVQFMFLWHCLVITDLKVRVNWFLKVFSTQVSITQ